MARTKALSVFWCAAPPLPGFKTSRLMTRILGGIFTAAALSCAATTVASQAILAAKHRQAPSNRFTTLFILCRPPRQRHRNGIRAGKGRTEIPARERVNWVRSAEAYSGRCAKSSEGTLESIGQTGRWLRRRAWRLLALFCRCRIVLVLARSGA